MYRKKRGRLIPMKAIHLNLFISPVYLIFILVYLLKSLEGTIMIVAGYMIMEFNTKFFNLGELVLNLTSMAQGGEIQDLT